MRRRKLRSCVLAGKVPVLVLLVAFSCRWIAPSDATLVRPVHTSHPFPLASLIGRTSRSHSLSAALLEIRGGSDEEDDDMEELEVEPLSTAMNTFLGISKKVVVVLGKAVMEATKVTTRVLKAAFEGEEPEEEEEEVSFLVKLSRKLQRMWSAAVNPPSDQDDDDNAEEGEEVTEQPPTSTQRPKAKQKKTVKHHHSPHHDFADYLVSAYGVESTRDELGDKKTPILGGSIADALQTARSKARLLLVFIPASKPNKRKSSDQVALESFLSQEASKLAEKRALKKGKTGSFAMWSAKAGSVEAVNAIKRLKAQQTNNKGQKRPILLVAYAAPVVDKRGVPRLAPLLLAQHHCSPPPSPEMTAAWLNALRKRHAKQFEAMQTELREAHYFKERKAGYKDSVQSDVERKILEKKAEEERIAQEKAEQERIEALKRRREELRESLPPEPSAESADVRTVALRLADGRSAKRRFSAGEMLSTLFDWVDVEFEMERERVVLTTMNGSKSFSYSTDATQSLSDAGLGRMVGLRVSQVDPVTEPTKDDAVPATEEKESSELAS